MALEEYILTKEEEYKALEAWNIQKMTKLKDIIIYVFGDESIDARHNKGKTVKKFLASREIKAQAAQEHIPKTATMALTNDQKEFISNNAANYTKLLFLARDVWGDQDITPLYTEFKLVKEFHETLDAKLKCQEGIFQGKRYSPPKSEIQAISRINRYTQASLEQDKLNQKDKECLKKLIKYCNTFRFISSMDELSEDAQGGSISDREFLESQFIKWTFDKPDLTEEEVDQYISLGLSMLETKNIDKELKGLRILRDEQLDDKDGKMNLALGQQINELGKRKDQIEKNQATIFKNLTGTRADRLERQGSSTASIAAMFELWKDKEKRDKIAKLMLRRKEKLLDEMKNLDTMDALKFEMFGLDDIEGAF